MMGQQQIKSERKNDVGFKDDVASKDGLILQNDVGFSNNTMSFNLYQKFFENFKEQNVVYSPYSILSAMSMVLLGCKGTTESELRSALSLDGVTDVHKAVMELREQLLKESGGIVLHTANRLFPDEFFAIKEDFLHHTKEYYGSEVQSVDFKKNAESSRKTINNWVYETTKQKIKNLIPGGTVSRDTTLVLVNAIYFKGMWMKKFDTAHTMKKDFHVNSKQIKRVDMMRDESNYNFAIDKKNGIQLLGIPYKAEGGRATTSMLVALPVKRFGLEKMEKLLDATKLYLLVKRFIKTKVELTLPKFKLEFMANLKAYFEKLGAQSIFSGSADLSGISEPEQLSISVIIHKAFIEVNEEGTEAAAATAVMHPKRLSKRAPLKPVKFVCDHPFQFFIIHKPTNTVLFAGRYANPE